MEFAHFGGFTAPEVIAIDVWESDNRAAFQDGETGIELGLPTGGQPDILGEDSSSDDRGLFRFDKSYLGVRVFGKQMFTKEALSKRPVLGKSPFQSAMHPSNPSRRVFILDPMPSRGGIHHYLTGSASALSIYLEENGDTLGRVLRWPDHDRRAYSKAAAFDDPSTPVATAVDIKTKYDAKCGTPSAGSPKVFFKYFYVNTATGEKSGEVLAQAKLSE